ncbi:MAG TPA: hybrid sensor histidine kinase/response regulator [Oligoflexia bacterium]|nr:hybrid sensor histidine kinase/response regulator [Oligoflexia bacterium]
MTANNQEQRIESLFSDLLFRCGVLFMILAPPVNLCWLLVDYFSEREQFFYFLFLRLLYSGFTIASLPFLRTKFVRDHFAAFSLFNYCLIVACIGLMVPVSKHFLPYSMGFASVFLAVAIVFVWRIRNHVAALIVTAVIIFTHWEYLQQRPLSELIVVSGFFVNVFVAIFAMTYLTYRAYRKQFRLLIENEEFKLALAAQVEELGKTNEALKSVNVTKDKFLSIIAHDLRGPIGSLDVLFNEVIKEGKDLHDEILDTVRSTARTVHLLLEQLLQWARSQQQRIEFNPSTFAIRKPVGECIGLLSTHARQKNIALIDQVSDSLFAYADPALVTTIIRNLINNAIKFTPQDGQITVSAQEADGMLKVLVSDTGVGISEETMGKLFKIEEKVISSPGTRNEEGSGLGLILCREFVQKNGGQIGVESKLGAGSTFWFTLPLGQKQEISLFDSSDRLKIVLGLKVLLVEDDELHQQTSSKVLRDLGLVYQLVDNGLKAVELAKEEKFDLILMDINLPGLNGIQASRRIWAGAAEKPWIIILSSYSRFELDEMAKDLRFQGYLNKPLSRTALLQTLTPLLNREQ